MFRNVKIAAAVMTIVGVFSVSAPVTYGETGAAGEAKVLSNSVCPVTDEKISKKTEVTYEYKGKLYSFCCRECIDEFKKDPAKYIEKMKKAGADNHEHAAR
jgi:YHS domain-containing protein